MNAPDMCDKRTRVWCCHIGLVFSISSILLSMMFQVWSYYFSLVDEMDTLSSARPYLGGFVEICDSNILKSWNLECVKFPSYFNCNLPAGALDTWVRSTCNGPLSNMSMSECCSVMVWVLPW